MDDAELARIRRLVHALICRDQLSAAEARQRLTAYQIERSAADIEQDLRLAGCESCGRRADSQPQPAQAAPDEPGQRPAARQTYISGYLTGMVGRG